MVFSVYTLHLAPAPAATGAGPGYREYFHRGIIINYAGQRSAPAPPPPRPRPVPAVMGRCVTITGGGWH